MTQTTLDRTSPIDQQEARRQNTQKNLKKQCERDREKVKGIFRFFECPGGTLSFSFRAYKWDPVETYRLSDGESYDLPLGVAKHLNKNGWYPEHHFLMDEGGQAHTKIGQKKRRFGFQSMEFVDPEEFGEAQDTEIVTVTPLKKK